MWCVSGSGIHDELQGLVCWRTVRQTSYVAKDGVTASGYNAEYTREIRANAF